jgi:hypothetical protein
VAATATRHRFIAVDHGTVIVLDGIKEHGLPTSSEQ